MNVKKAAAAAATTFALTAVLSVGQIARAPASGLIRAARAQQGRANMHP